MTNQGQVIMTSFDIFTNRVPFGLLSEEEQKALKRWEGGWEYFRSNGTWEILPNPGWYKHYVYRAKPIPIIKPSINWDHVSTEYNWLAVDSDGDAFLYKNKPYMADRGWSYNITRAASVRAFSSYSRGNVPWQDSLVGRPVKENLL